ncbi:hypothetical protein GIB67_031932 [Kingdonia uniflora]|uniref:BTB domain-containing protein n=1 Tax=Kingdonia uniflora TaxID=39325 RepID=A0A7J7NU73_9MAGN|nr:hypothetical protein GIB67_031932 [Kingdonia uniflora]
MSRASLSSSLSSTEPSSPSSPFGRGFVEEIMKCVSCHEDYKLGNAGTCKECYEEASETKEDLKREIEDLKSKIGFLRICSPIDCNNNGPSSSNGFTDVVLIASGEEDGDASVHAHKAVLASRSPVFKAMLENEMEESRSGKIKMSCVPYDVLQSFVHFLYTAEVVSMDEQIASDLLVLADKYQVKHLKAYCEKFMSSKLNIENALMRFAFASQHNAQDLLAASLSIIIGNMDKITKRVEYKELVEEDPRVIVGIFEAYLAKQVNTAASNHSALPNKLASVAHASTRDLPFF